MVSEVNGSLTPAVVNADPRATAVDRPKDTQPAPGSAGANSTQSRDTVSLTQEASQLRALETAVAQAPEVDRQKVDQVRQALADGSYHFDAKRTAEKLMQMESLLPPAAAEQAG